MSATSGHSGRSALSRPDFKALIEANRNAGAMIGRDSPPVDVKTTWQLALYVIQCTIVFCFAAYVYAYVIDVDITLHSMLFMCLFLVVMTLATERSEYVKDNQGSVAAVTWMCYVKHTVTKRGSWWLYIGMALILLAIAAMYMCSGPTIVVIPAPSPGPGPAPGPSPVPRNELYQSPPVAPPVYDINRVSTNRRRRSLDVRDHRFALLCNGEVVNSQSIRVVVGPLDLSRLSDCLHESISHDTLEEHMSHVIWEASNLPVVHTGDNTYRQIWIDMQIDAVLAAANPDRENILRAYADHPDDFDGPLAFDIHMARVVFDAVSEGGDVAALESSTEVFTRTLRLRMDKIEANEAWLRNQDYIMSKIGAVAGWYLASKLVSAVIGPAEVIALEGPTVVVNVAEAVSTIASGR